MSTILVIVIIYIASYAYIGYEMKNAIVVPDDFEEDECEPSKLSASKEVDEEFWFNTAAAI